MRNEEREIFAAVIDEIHKSSMSEADKRKAIQNLQELRKQELNVMITGATGCGKSSTINALFDADVAKVGVGVDPETMSIQKYNFKNMILWDSPGLGDGKESDARHAKNIREKLNEKTRDGKALIDVVLVILDGGSRDLGTSYDLINQVIIPNLGPRPSERILVAINQCDMAMKGKHWNSEENMPDATLMKFLDDKVESVKRRIYEGTGVDVEPIYYSAGYTDGVEKQNPYNLTKLLYYLIKHTPDEKRLVYVDHVSRDTTRWKSTDRRQNYAQKIEKSWYDTAVKSALAGAEIGGKIGRVVGGPIGEAVGKAFGAACGFIKGLFS